MIIEIFINTIRRRFKAYIPLIMLAVSIFMVFFNMIIYFKGIDASALDESRKYQIRFLNIDKNDIEIFNTDPYVDSFYTDPTGEHLAVYVKLKKPQMQYLAETFLHFYEVLDLKHNNFYSTLSADFEHGIIIDSFTNENYYRLSSQGIFSTIDFILTFFYIVAGIIIAMSCRAVTQKYNRELFIYKFIGLTKNKVIFTYQIILLTTVGIAAIIATFVSLIFMKAFCSFSVGAFTGTNISTAYFVIPIVNLLYAFVIVAAWALVFYGISLSKHIKNTPIISGINDLSYYSVFQVSRSAKTEVKKVGYLGWLYFKRSISGNINDIIIVALVMLIPMLLLNLALISKAQTQVHNRDELCAITYAPPPDAPPTWIIREFCDSLLDIDGVKSLGYAGGDDKEGYSQILVFAKSGMEETVFEKINALIPNEDYYIINFFDKADATKLLSISYYYFFLSQSILLMLCSFIIILLQQWSAMLRRKREFVIYKVLGYTPAEIARIMRSRYIDITVSVLITTIIVNLLVFVYSQYEKTTTIFTVFQSLPGVSGPLFTALHITVLFGFAYAAAAISGAYMLKKIKSDEILVNSGDVL